MGQVALPRTPLPRYVVSGCRSMNSSFSSCESDLARELPLAVVAKWMGNTQAVALRHYVDVTDADFERAVACEAKSMGEAAQKAAQQVHAMDRSSSHATKATDKKAPVLRGSASSCDTLQNRGMEAAVSG